MTTMVMDDIRGGRCEDGKGFYTRRQCGHRGRWVPTGFRLQYQDEDTVYTGPWGWLCGVHFNPTRIEEEWTRRAHYQARIKADEARRTRQARIDAAEQRVINEAFIHRAGGPAAPLWRAVDNLQEVRNG